MIPGPVGAIATICDIGLSYATGDFSALGKSLLSAIITGGFKTYINNACKIPKALKYIAGTVFAGYGLSIISKSYTMIRDSALQFVDLMFSGGSPLDYAHVLCNFFQGLAGLAGGVGFAVGSAVGMVRQCFVAGTKVKTEDGDKNIEEIKAGDIVWSYDPLTGEEGLKEVKQTFENETETLVHVTVSNENDKETIDTTVRHPFYVVGYGFRYASELRIGDKVRSVSGDIYEVTSVEIEQLDEPVKIYNFEVEDWHTYFVSESGILVHNMCAKKSGTEIKKESRKNKNKDTKGESGNVIPWSSKTVSDASKQLASGDRSVTVENRSQAEELFLGMYQGDGYKNVTGMDAMDSKNLNGGEKGLTYHWDDVFDSDGNLLGHGADNPDSKMPHLQIHPPEGKIIRIFFGKSEGDN